MRRRATILLTGFGPFPGVPDNASALLVPKLAHLVARRFRAHRVVARILPTEWEAVPDRLAAHYARERPCLGLHFGVSERASGFVIETLARNVRDALPDAAGAMPRAACVVEKGPECLTTNLPTEEIVARLGALGLPACLSNDAGAYLCNTALYTALALADEGPRTPAIGFVHIPVSLERRGNGKPVRGRRLDWEGALAGGLEIIRACLGRPVPARGDMERGVKPR
jgi:pyroglutamyl-peptidase